MHGEQGFHKANQSSCLGGLFGGVRSSATYGDEQKDLRQAQRNIERVFVDMKEKHGMRWTTLRGLEKVSIQAMLVFSCMNLKKLAT
jgi:hypothetical protein